MNKKKNLNILKFPTNIVEAERQVEAILFAAEGTIRFRKYSNKIEGKS